MENTEPQSQKGPEVPQMSLRVKVAELCGWTNIHLQFPDNPQSSLLGENLTMFGHGAAYIPDYPNDLNACAEFERVIPKTPFGRDGLNPHGRYELNLMLEVRAENYHDPRRLWNATAEQRCRAFIAAMESSMTHEKLPKP